jgi:single-strand DNA-binding protein
MAKELNKVQLTGRLGADPEMRFTPQGHAVTTFRVASNRSWRSSDGETHEDTEWFRVVAWNKLAEICNQFLAKGARVYVEGRLQTRQWQDQEGQPRSSTEVIANDMIMLDSRRDITEPLADERVPAPAVISVAPTSAAVASVRSVASGKSAGAKAAKVAPLPRGKAAFEEEDLPF